MGLPGGLNSSSTTKMKTAGVSDAPPPHTHTPPTHLLEHRNWKSLGNKLKHPWTWRKSEICRMNSTIYVSAVHSVYFLLSPWILPAWYIRAVCVTQYTTYLNLIIFSYGHAAAVVFLSEFFWEGWAHDFPPHVAGSIEMPLAVLPPVGGQHFIELHLVLLALKHRNKLEIHHRKLKSYIHLWLV